MTAEKKTGAISAPVRQTGNSVSRTGQSLPLGLACRVHGYANEHECDDNHQRCDDDLHGYSSLNDLM